MSEILKRLKYSVLDLASTIKGESYLDTFQKTAKSAQFVEKLGYTRYWLSEHHNMANVVSSSTAILINYVAQQTTSIRVGSGGIMLPNHSNLAIAEAFGTLSTLYPDRIDLGLGRAPGTDQRTAMVLRRGTNIYDYDFEKNIQELFQLFSSENKNASVRAFPGEGIDIPIYILGSSTDSAHLAAKLGLPYAFAGHFAPTQFYRAMEIYHAEFKPSTHLSAPYAMACVNIMAADTDEEAYHIAKSHFQTVINILTNRRGPLLPPDEIELNLQDPSLKQAFESWTALTFIGSQSSLTEQLEKFVASTQVDEIIAYTNIYDFEAKLHSYEITSNIFK